MGLQQKYAELISAAKTKGVGNLTIAEKGAILHITGVAKSTADYDALWAVYTKIDPNMSGDLVMNIDILANAGAKLKVTTESTNLNIRATPSTDGAIVGKAAHNEIVTLVEKTDDSWWKIKTKDGEEGFAFAQYLSPV
jgi:uncharacterized protein YgiM (DUF1202 family)